MVGCPALQRYVAAMARCLLVPASTEATKGAIAAESSPLSPSPALRRVFLVMMPALLLVSIAGGSPCDFGSGMPFAACRRQSIGKEFSENRRLAMQKLVTSVREQCLRLCLQEVRCNRADHTIALRILQCNCILLPGQCLRTHTRPLKFAQPCLPSIYCSPRT